MKCPVCGRKPILKGALLQEGAYTLECKSQFSHAVSVYGDSPETAYALWVKAFAPLRPWWQFWK